MTLIGASAPDFELPDQHGRRWQLSEAHGRGALLVFFPFAFTGVCTGELRALRDEVTPSLPDDMLMAAVSCDSMFALRVFAEREGLDFPLLSDFWPHGAVASSYGVFDAERGCAIRGSFLVDADGIVRWSVINAMPDARDVADYRRALGDLTAIHH
jgi:mycoredoxin-dependent peroxiredoxin